MTTAFVTGASGFVGAELVRQLLQRGYKVRAAVRTAPDSPKLRHLVEAAANGPGALQLFQVPSLQEASQQLDDALAGSTHVFHVASPFRFDGDPRADIVEPALAGTEVVLRAAAKHKQPGQRVVLTSSVCAIHDMNRKQPAAAPDGKYTEADWNEVSEVDSEAYWVSKVEAERLAWRLAEELGLDLVTILPNFVLGPVFGGATGGVSVGFMKEFLEAPGGKVPTGSWTVEDVRDVAAAHILAAETPGASGRYIISLPSSIDARAVTDAIKRKWPAAAGALPDGADAPATTTIGTLKAQQELGLVLRPVEETLADMAESLIVHGIATPAWAAAA